MQPLELAYERRQGAWLPVCHVAQDLEVRVVGRIDRLRYAKHRVRRRRTTAHVRGIFDIVDH